jgi:hypothetical protein
MDVFRDHAMQSNPRHDNTALRQNGRTVRVLNHSFVDHTRTDIIQYTWRAASQKDIRHACAHVT